MCFAFWARVDTKCLNLSHHFKSMDGWPGDAIFFPVGPTFGDHPHVFSQKRSSPLEFIFDTCASAEMKPGPRRNVAPLLAMRSCSFARSACVCVYVLHRP